MQVGTIVRTWMFWSFGAGAKESPWQSWLKPFATSTGLSVPGAGKQAHLLRALPLFTSRTGAGGDELSLPVLSLPWLPKKCKRAKERGQEESPAPLISDRSLLN